MLCPHCQVNLIVNKRQSVEINACPKCNGIWLENGSLEKIMAQTQSPNNQEELISNTQENIDKDSIQDVKKNQKRRHPHFLSGAFDDDDW